MIRQSAVTPEHPVCKTSEVQNLKAELSRCGEALKRYPLGYDRLLFGYNKECALITFGKAVKNVMGLPGTGGTENKFDQSIITVAIGNGGSFLLFSATAVAFLKYRKVPFYRISAAPSKRPSREAFVVH